MKIRSALYVSCCLAVSLRPLRERLVVDTQAGGYDDRLATRIPQDSVRIVQDQKPHDQEFYLLVQGQPEPAQEYYFTVQDTGIAGQVQPAKTMHQGQLDPIQAIDTTQYQQKVAYVPTSPCPKADDKKAQKDVKIEQETSIEFDSSRIVNLIQDIQQKQSTDQTLTPQQSGLSLLQKRSYYGWNPHHGRWIPPRGRRWRGRPHHWRYPVKGRHRYWDHRYW
jgi:hypothetical protein